jgi:phosphate transport system permease protein
MTPLTDARPSTLARADVSLAERLDVPRRVVFIAAVSMVLLVVAILGFIAWNGIQIVLVNGIPLNEIFSTTWNPGSEKNPMYGIVPFIAGTIGVTAIAVIIAAPLSIGLAMFLAEVAPGWAKAIVQPSLEVFVGIPSVVWGFLGVIALVPFLRTNFAWAGFTLGFSWFAGSLVVAIMILPTITAVAYDVFRAVPSDLRTASMALGTTRWQMIRHVVVPASRAGLLTAIVLGMTRAAGEALAVQMVIGNRPTMPTSLTQPVTTLTSQITLDMGNTVFGEAWNNALWTMGLVLLTISLGFVLFVRVLNRRSMGA